MKFKDTLLAQRNGLHWGIKKTNSSLSRPNNSQFRLIRNKFLYMEVKIETPLLYYYNQVQSKREIQCRSDFSTWGGDKEIITHLMNQILLIFIISQWLHMEGIGALVSIIERGRIIFRYILGTTLVYNFNRRLLFDAN